MPLRAPNLDDRDFEQLLSEAKARVRQACPQWELSESDPAEVLLEAFAHLTEVMIYRLNRLPEKAYIEFLSLLGLRMQPPTAASAELTFSRSRATESAGEIPRASRVAGAPPTRRRHGPHLRFAPTFPSWSVHYRNHAMTCVLCMLHVS